jgi:predicted phage terminase large subunit-like protein
MNKNERKIIKVKLNYYRFDISKPKELSKYYTDGLFWPTRYPSKVLEGKKRELTESEYSGQFQQRPSPSEGLVFKQEWFGLRFRPSDLPEDIARHFYTDSAFGVESGDNSASACWSILKGNIYIWATLVLNKGLTEWIREYQEFVRINRGDYRSAHFVENKASGLDIENVLKAQTSFNVILHKLPGKESKRMRAEASTPTARGGRVYLLEGGVWVDSFLHELTSYPKGRFDDQVDMFSGLVANSDLSEPEEGEEEDVHF